MKIKQSLGEFRAEASRDASMNAKCSGSAKLEVDRTARLRTKHATVRSTQQSSDEHKGRVSKV